MNKTKVCSTCGRRKYLEKFAKDRTRKDGYSGRCKLCVAASSKKWRDGKSEVEKKDYTQKLRNTHYKNAGMDKSIRYTKNDELLLECLSQPAKAKSLKRLLDKNAIQYLHKEGIWVKRFRRDTA